MPLEDLVSVIETLKQRIRDHGGSLRQNETRTRAALIDPLLTALGWDVSDPALVTPEYRVEVGWADYALRGPGTQPSAVVEAKRLGSFLENHLDQAVGYCITQGISYAAITDGNHWQLYRTFEPVPISEKRVLDISLDSASAHECVLNFLLLWRPNLSTGKAIAANEPLLYQPPSTGSSVQQTSEPGSNYMPEPSPPKSPVSENGWVQLADFVPKTGTKPPTEIRFPDNTNSQIKIWRHVEQRTVEWLWEKGLLNAANLPVQSSPQRYIVHTSPQHPQGNQFAQVVPLTGTPLYLEGNVSSLASTANAKTLLTHCDQSLLEVLLKLG